MTEKCEMHGGRRQDGGRKPGSVGAAKSRLQQTAKDVAAHLFFPQTGRSSSNPPKKCGFVRCENPRFTVTSNAPTQIKLASSCVCQTTPLKEQAVLAHYHAATYQSAPPDPLTATVLEYLNTKVEDFCRTHPFTTSRILARPFTVSVFQFRTLSAPK